MASKLAAFCLLVLIGCVSARATSLWKDLQMLTNEESADSRSGQQIQNGFAVKRLDNERVIDTECSEGGQGCGAPIESESDMESSGGSWLNVLRGWGKRASPNAQMGWGKRTMASSDEAMFSQEKELCSDVRQVIEHHLEQLYKYTQMIDEGKCIGEKDLGVSSPKQTLG